MNSPTGSGPIEMVTPRSDLTNVSISFRHAYKCFGTTEVIADLCLDIYRGESLSIIGPSGSGKTTTLLLAALLEPLTSGEILFEGTVVSNGPRFETDPDRLRRRLGIVFQEYNLWQNKTVLQNLTEGPRFVMNVSRREAVARAHHWLERVGLDRAHAGRYPNELSGGQRQRAAIARALMMEPEVLLFDEVTSALDVENTVQLLVLLESLQRDGGRTLVFVTHHLNFAQRASTRTAVVIGGRVVEVGLPREVINRPREEATRSFLSVVQDTW